MHEGMCVYKVENKLENSCICSLSLVEINLYIKKRINYKPQFTHKEQKNHKKLPALKKEPYITCRN